VEGCAQLTDTKSASRVMINSARYSACSWRCLSCNGNDVTSSSSYLKIGLAQNGYISAKVHHRRTQWTAATSKRTPHRKNLSRVIMAIVVGSHFGACKLRETTLGWFSQVFAILSVDSKFPDSCFLNLLQLTHRDKEPQVTIRRVNQASVQ